MTEEEVKREKEKYKDLDPEEYKIQKALGICSTVSCHLCYKELLIDEIRYYGLRGKEINRYCIICALAKFCCDWLLAPEFRQLRAEAERQKRE